MKEIIEKLKNIRDEIISEKNQGKLRFFGLIARADLEGKWDILLSADWFKENNKEKDLVYFIEKLKNKFKKDLEFLSKIVLLAPSEMFIQQLAKVIITKGLDTEKEITDLKVFADFTVKRIFVVALDFTGIDLTKIQETKESPIVIKDANDFK